MATVHAVLSRIKGRAYTGATMPVVDAQTITSKTVTSTGTSAEVSGISASDTDQFWSITVTGGNVYAAFGATATAGANNGWLLIDGTTRDFSPNAAGEKLFIKDA